MHHSGYNVVLWHRKGGLVTYWLMFRGPFFLLSWYPRYLQYPIIAECESEQPVKLQHIHVLQSKFESTVCEAQILRGEVGFRRRLRKFLFFLTLILPPSKLL